tara:strand:- start:178 stop:1440 length:1263 start_codon:yes stop_codon:yes gene_type:complete
MISLIKNYLQDKDNYRSIAVMILTLSSSLIGIFSHKLIIKNYSTDILEFYLLTISWFLLTSSFFHFGSRPTYVTLREDSNNQLNYFFTSSIFGILNSIFFGFMTYILIKKYILGTIYYESLFIVIPLFFLVQTINIFISFYLISINKSVQGILLTFLNLPISFTFIYFKTFDNLFFGFILSHLMSLIICLPFLLKLIDYRKINFSMKSLKFNFVKNFPLSIKYTFSDFIDVLTNRVSVFFLAYYANDLTEMVEFSIALSLLKISMIGINSLSTVYVSKLFDSIKLKSDEFLIIFNKIRFSFILISLFSFFVIYFLGEKAILYFYSEKYIYAFRLLMILQFGQLIHSFFGPISLVAILTGFPIMVATLKLFFTTIMVIFNFLFFDKYGLDVLAFSYVGLLFFWNLSLLFKMKSHFTNKRAY